MKEVETEEEVEIWTLVAEEQEEGTEVRPAAEGTVVRLVAEEEIEGVTMILMTDVSIGFDVCVCVCFCVLYLCVHVLHAYLCC